MSASCRVRVRVRAQAPLPVAQFVVPVQAGTESLAALRTRILDVLRRHFPAPVLDDLHVDDLLLSVEGYQLLDEFGSDVLADGEVVRYVHFSPSVSTHERPIKRQRTDDVLAEASRIAQSMRSAAGASVPPRAEPALPEPPMSRLTAAMGAFEQRKREWEAAQDTQSTKRKAAQLDASDEDSEDSSSDSTPASPSDSSSDSSSASSSDSSSESDSDSSSESSSDSSKESSESPESSASDSDSDSDSSSEDESSSDSSDASDSDESSDTSDSSDASQKRAGLDDKAAVPQTNDSSAQTPFVHDTQDSASDAPSIEEIRHDETTEYEESPVYVPPGQGKARTRRKNQKRREKQRVLSLADAPSAHSPAPLSHDTSLPPGGGALDLLPASTAQPPIDATGARHEPTPTPSESPLEQIAARMLARTTVGHRKRRNQSSRVAPLIQPAAEPVTPHPLAVQTNIRRVPPPSQRPPSEIPQIMTLSSTDCEAWYNEQWDADESAAAQAYSDMQRSVRDALEREKAAEAAEAGVEADDTVDPLRAALPMAFGRGGHAAMLPEDLVYEAPEDAHDEREQGRPGDASGGLAPAHGAARAPPEPSEKADATDALGATPAESLDYGPPEPPRAPASDSVLHRLRTLQAAVFGHHST